MGDFETREQHDCQGAVAVGVERASNHPATSRAAGGTGAAPGIRHCHGDGRRPRLGQDWEPMGRQSRDVGR